jgi:DNA transformation protein
MFGGYGLYIEGVMMALIADETLYFKVDDSNRDDYIRAGMQPFTYDGKHKPIQMSYYQVPDAILDDLEQLILWIEKAHAAARRAKRKPAKKSKKAPSADRTAG